MTDKAYNPFTDRKSRDIRNSLSVALAESVRSGSSKIYRRCARRWMDSLEPGSRADFVRDRLRRYDRVFEEVRSGSGGNPLAAALIFWNHRLYFEFHEIVEELWTGASGGLKDGLKGMVQAAGFFVHMEAGREEAAVRLGARAACLLSENRDSLAFVVNLEDLIRGLKTGDWTHVFLTGDFSKRGRGDFTA